MKGAVKLAREGWSDAPKLSAGESFQSLRDYAHGEEEGTVASVSGSFLDIGAFIADEPECFQDFVEVETPKGITLGVNIVASANESPKSMINKGIAILAVADELERSGFSVSLVVICSSHNQGNTATLTIPIKKAGERTDENQIAYWSCHPSALRQLFFRWQDRLPKEWIAKMAASEGRGKPNRTKKFEGVDYVFTSGLDLGDEKKTLTYYKNEMEQIEKMLAGQKA